MSPEPGHGTGEDDAAPPSVKDAAPDTGQQAIPLAEEVLRIGKVLVETGRVRVAVTTGTVDELVRQTLRTRHARVERVTLGHEVREAPQTREEDGVLVIPVVEEILVVEKRLVLKEEIRLRFVDSEENVEQLVGRRVQRATITSMPSTWDAADRAPGALTANDGDKETAS